MLILTLEGIKEYSQRLMTTVNKIRLLFLIEELWRRDLSAYLRGFLSKIFSLGGF